jgi:hypothetical protein
MRKPPPPHPRGTPRTAGSGRKKGTPNRRTVEMRQLMSSLCHDVDYQYRLRADFRRRRVHPAVETLVWSHVIGKPTERVQLAAEVTMNQKLDQERELFRQLPIEQLEILAAESQALVNKAMMMVKENALTSGATTAPRAPVDGSESNGEPAGQPPGTDVDDA